MKRVMVGLVALCALTGCGLENQENEKQLHNLMAIERASGKQVNWILWMQRKELPRKPDRLDTFLHIFGASNLHASVLPIPIRALEQEAECDELQRRRDQTGEFLYFCRPVGYKF